jgi:two-component system chemotaxis response regulator CheY
MPSCLIVDDSSVVRKVAKRILGGTDLNLREADGGNGAVMECRVQMPDVVLLDSTLPDMKVEDVIRAINELAGPDHKPQILVGMIEMDVVRIMRSKRAGASGFFMKPFNRESLMKSINLKQAA